MKVRRRDTETEKEEKNRNTLAGRGWVGRRYLDFMISFPFNGYFASVTENGLDLDLYQEMRLRVYKV